MAVADIVWQWTTLCGSGRHYAAVADILICCGGEAILYDAVIYLPAHSGGDLLSDALHLVTTGAQHPHCSPRMHQESVLSPFLVADVVTEFARADSLSLVMYADDLVLMSETQE